ncbi:MAG: glycosyltransferase family 4 protein [bacterium]|nr:glycosyltransferase family 4 protein [bacterium]
MKILIATGIYPPDIGGPATYSKLLKEELPGQGIEVEVVTFGKLKKYPWILRQPVYFIKVFLAARNADIIYAQDVLNSGISALIAGKLWKKKFLLKIVGDYAWEQGVQRFGVKEVLDEFLDKKYGFRVELFRKLERLVAHHAEKIIVPSEYLKKVVMKWGIESKKIIVIYNAFEQPRDNELFRFPRPAHQLIVSAGRLVPWKGFDALIEIMPELVKKIPDLKLVIIGDGPERTKLEKMISDVALPKAQVLQDLAQGDGPSRAIRHQTNMRVLAKSGAEAIEFTGNLPRQKVLEYLGVADVFVLNTSYEGLSHQILEAMALGVPVVTTNVGGNPELIKNEESGFLVGFNDKNALKSTILEILDNPAIAQKLAQNAKKKAEEFSKERMINETIKLMQNL